MGRRSQPMSPAAALSCREAGSIALIERSPVKRIAVAYFQWDHRDYGAMKVWLPLEDKRRAANVRSWATSG